MKTDVLKLKHANNRYGQMLLISIVLMILGFFIILNVTTFLVGLIIFIIFGILYSINNKEYARHVQLMQEHGYKSPEMIIEWLLSASYEDCMAFLDFLEKDSLDKLSSIMEDKMYISPQKELSMLYRKIRSKIND
ncbi:MAG: hypothetical protein E7012_02110 [Alphaproteobacteria bacterium]|nr:hypothetical protein [Alphaproteobacteria bacterium]